MKLRPGWIALGALALLAQGCGHGRAAAVQPRRPAALIAAPAGGPVAAVQLEACVPVIEKRLKLAGIRGVGVRIDGKAIRIELPPGTDRAGVVALVERPGRLSFRDVPQFNTVWGTESEIVGRKHTGYERILDQNGPVSPDELRRLVFSKAPEFASEQLKPNSVVTAGDRRYQISFEFVDNEKRSFEEFTRRMRGKRLALFVDDRLVCVPTMMAPIPGKGVLEAGARADEAERIALFINSGPLPVALRTMSISEQTGVRR